MSQLPPSDVSLSTPSRQAPAAILVILLRFFFQLLRQAWPLAIALLMNRGSDKQSWLVLGAAMIAIVPALFSIISYFKFYFFVKDNHLHVQQGILEKKHLQVPFERIQSINFKQNILHQLFNVVSVEIDTAGSSKSEVSIDALEKSKAEELRNYILSQKENAPSQANLESQAERKPLAQHLLFQLSIGDLLKIGISQNHFRMLGLLFAFIFSIYQFAGEAFGERALRGQIRNFINDFSEGSNWIIILLLCLTVLGITFIATLIGTVLKYYDFHFWKTEQGFRISSGLFNKREQAAVLHKIQSITWGSNPIKRLFHLLDLQLKQASGQHFSQKQTLYAPGCYAEQVAVVQEAYFPNYSQTPFQEHRIDPAIIQYRMYMLGVLPVLLLSVAYYFLHKEINIYILFWLPIYYTYNYLYHKNFRYYTHEEGLRIYEYVISSKNEIMRWEKVQSISIKQSFSQRKKQLANIEFLTAGGSLTIPYIALSQAHDLRNYVLYKIAISAEKEL